VDPCPDLEVQVAHAIADGDGTSHRTSGSVERRQEAVANGVDLVAGVSVELSADEPVVLGQQARQAGAPIG
jgi:hypothetical protein